MVTQLRSDPIQQKHKHGGFLGLFGKKINKYIEHYEKKLEDIEVNVKLQQSEASLAGEVCGNLCSLFLKK